MHLDPIRNCTHRSHTHQRSECSFAFSHFFPSRLLPLQITLWDVAMSLFPSVMLLTIWPRQSSQCEMLARNFMRRLPKIWLRHDFLFLLEFSPLFLIVSTRILSPSYSTSIHNLCLGLMSAWCAIITASNHIFGSNEVRLREMSFRMPILKF